MTISTAVIQSLYIAYFNRPADPGGLQFYQTSTGATPASIGAAFAASPEYTSLYEGKAPFDVINTIYLNLFGRVAEPAGLLFWADALSKGYVTKGNIALEILNGAQNADKIAITSKISAATAFTTSLDTNAELVGYNGSAANGVAADWLKGIVNKDTLDAATTPEALLAVSTAATAAHDGQNNVGKTLSATVAIDTILGSNGNDIINVFASGTKADGSDGATLSANDSIDGGAGIDTLNIEVLANPAAGPGVPNFNGAQVGTIKNVEIINISGADLLNGATVDATKYQGSTNVNIQSAAAAVAVTGLAGKTLGVGAGYAATSITADFNSAAATVALNGVASGLTVDIVNAKSTTLNVSGSVADVAGDAGTVLLENAGAKVATLNLNLKSAAVVDVTGLAALTSIVSLGGSDLELAGATATLQNVTTGAGKDYVEISFDTVAAAGATAAKNATVSTGAGNDEIHVATTGTGLTTVDAGAGDDKIFVEKVTGAALSITAGAGDDTVTLTGDALAITDVIDGGDGVDTIALAGTTAARSGDDIIVLTKLIKNFESLRLTTAEGHVADAAVAQIALDVSTLASYSTFTFAAGDSFVKGITDEVIVVGGSATSVTATADKYVAKATATAAATVYAGTLSITDTADTSASTVVARADTVNLTIKGLNSADVATPVTAAVTLTGDVKTATIVINNGLDVDDGATVHDNQSTVNVTTAGTANALKSDFGLNALGNLATLNLEGSGAAVVRNADGTKLVTVDASKLGGTYTVTDGAHVKGDATIGLNYETLNTAAETIKLGSGIDSVTFLAGSSTWGSIGGTAKDTVTGLNLVLNAGGTALAASSDQLHVTGASAAFVETTTQTDLDLALKGFAAKHVSGTTIFAFGGDTYVYSDIAGAGTVDAADVLVKLTGTIDLAALKVALG